MEKLILKNFCLHFCLLLISVMLQSCATTSTKFEETSRNSKSVAEEDLSKELQEIKTLVGGRNVKRDTLHYDKLKQPIEFGMSLEKVIDIFPAPDKNEYKPFVNGKVTMLVREIPEARFNFLFYNKKVYKIILMKRWGGFSLRLAEKEINNIISVFLENYGKPDQRNSDDGAHQKMTWIQKEREVIIEVFSLMSHSGLERVFTLVYADRDIDALAKRSESFEIYRTKQEGILDQ